MKPYDSNSTVKRDGKVQFLIRPMMNLWRNCCQSDHADIEDPHDVPRQAEPSSGQLMNQVLRPGAINVADGNNMIGNDVEVLLNLKDQFRNNRMFPNWTTEASNNKAWNGVQFSHEGSVITLWLNSNELSGSIPHTLGSLVNLRSLYLYDNQLSGSIPETMGRLVNLNVLDLNNNQLSGSIPDTLGSLVNLTSLHVNNNHLSGSIPNTLGSMVNLKWLYLYNNQLSGSIPETMGRLVNLNVLDLNNNQLSGSIPKNLGSLVNLVSLNFSNNQLSGSIPDTLGSLVNLQLLYLKDNQLSGSIPDTVGKLVNLDVLNLSNNQLSGSIPSTLGSLLNLSWLYLNSNHLTGSIPNTLGGLVNLENLDLSHNQLDGQIPRDLRKLSRMETLQLSDNKLSGQVPLFLPRLKGLQELNLNGNEFRDPDTSSLEDDVEAYFEKLISFRVKDLPTSTHVEVKQVLLKHVREELDVEHEVVVDGKKCIGDGSNGTKLFEGTLDGHPVAVKRIPSRLLDLANNEIAVLVTLKGHVNLVGYLHRRNITEEYTEIFLELCKMSLLDLMTKCAPTCDSMGAQGNETRSAENVLSSHLWSANDYSSSLIHPTPVLLELIHDMARGMDHLHQRNIAHRDVKPGNVLIALVPNTNLPGGTVDVRTGLSVALGRTHNRDVVCAKLSDFGLSMKAPEGHSTLLGQHTAVGTREWMAPEVLNKQDFGRAADMFSLGCVFFFCLSKGRHPFGDEYHIVSNIVMGQYDMSAVSHVPEAEHLITCLLQREPEKRPISSQVLQHPLFWNSEKRIAFISTVKDYLFDCPSDILTAVEATASTVFVSGSWNDNLDKELVDDLLNPKNTTNPKNSEKNPKKLKINYKCGEVRDLLRAIRNKFEHYNESPTLKVPHLFGPTKDGVEAYFRKKFPRLLIEVYRVVWEKCRGEETFKKFF